MKSNIEIFTIKNAQKGDERAWHELFGWHFEPVYHYCLKLASGQQDIAEDVAQQVFVTAARNINKYKPQQSAFRAWLLGIAKNSFMKLNSKEVRRKRHETRVFSRSSEQQNNHSLHLLVYETLAQLPDHYRLVLEAKYLQGLTVNQIAEAQGHTVKAMESLLTRARDKFANVYKRVCK
ncbi:unnamed protein product [marine sediment metagenome]|uniref:RNA polymerase sigma-70 region 2 domain-containing protein n=1 Tax=marine sediment metagenome TaxID=412755 RepID=X1TW00_9ZZZZ